MNKYNLFILHLSNETLTLNLKEGVYVKESGEPAELRNLNLTVQDFDDLYTLVRKYNKKKIFTDALAEMLPRFFNFCTCEREQDKKEALDILSLHLAREELNEITSASCYFYDSFILFSDCDYYPISYDDLDIIAPMVCQKMKEIKEAKEKDVVNPFPVDYFGFSD